MEARPRSTPAMVVVDGRIVAEMHIQVEREGADKKAVSSGEVGIQASAGRGSAVVVVVVAAAAAAVEVDMGYVEAGVAETHTWNVAVGNTRSVVAAAELKSRRAGWGCYPTSLTLPKGHVRVSAGEAVVGCRVEVAVGVELAEMVPRRIGSAPVQGSTNCTDFEAAVEVEVVTWLTVDECLWKRKMIQAPSEVIEKAAGAEEQRAGVFLLVVAAAGKRL